MTRQFLLAALPHGTFIILWYTNFERIGRVKHSVKKHESLPTCSKKNISKSAEDFSLTLLIHIQCYSLSIYEWI